MTHTLSELLNAELVHYIRVYEEIGPESVVEILDFKDDTEGSGGCDTCYFEWAVVRITYSINRGRAQKFIYSGSFIDLIRELTSS